MPRLCCGSCAVFVVSAAVLCALADGLRATGTWAPRRLRRGVASAVLLAGAARGDDGLLTQIDSVDTNGDGLIDSDEFQRAAHAAVAEMPTPEVWSAWLHHYADLFAASDIDGDGILDDREVFFFECLEELAASSQTVMAGAPDYVSEATKMIFDMIDENQDGKIDLEERIRSVQMNADEWRLRDRLGFDDDTIRGWVKEVFEYVDMEGDGFLGRREFLLSDFVFSHDIEERLCTMVFRGMTDLLDENSDNFLTMEEVEKGMFIDHGNRERAERGGDMRAHDADSIMRSVAERFRMADADGDGVLNRAEMWILAGTVARQINREF
mmetsp:Transcript_132639/g.383474  ORF Transcript_132639/g.383474 Transcript_132639/m.383474 type:complete len:325 (-) Transcript_132639:84-1058(-)